MQRKSASGHNEYVRSFNAAQISHPGSEAVPQPPVFGRHLTGGCEPPLQAVFSTSVALGERILYGQDQFYIIEQ